MLDQLRRQEQPRHLHPLKPVVQINQPSLRGDLDHPSVPVVGTPGLVASARAALSSARNRSACSSTASAIASRSQDPSALLRPARSGLGPPATQALPAPLPGPIPASSDASTLVLRLEESPPDPTAPARHRQALREAGCSTGSRQKSPASRSVLEQLPKRPPIRLKIVNVIVERNPPAAPTTPVPAGSSTAPGSALQTQDSAAPGDTPPRQTPRAQQPQGRQTREPMRSQDPREV
jgi:hypothetical protein